MPRESHACFAHPFVRFDRGPGRLASIAIWAGTALLLQGCADDSRKIESTVRYEPPMERRVVVETIVDLPFDSAWDELIRRLSEGSFRISNLERASKFVSVELNRSTDLAARSNQPARYVDCGRSVRTLVEDGRSERFEYDVARSSQHRESDVLEDGFRVSDVSRRVDLRAQATIYLQPEGETRTRVTLNSRYKVDIEISGDARLMPLDPDLEAGAPSPFGPRIESVRFTTHNPGRDSREGGLICRATGDFEHALIALANPAAAI